MYAAFGAWCFYRLTIFTPQPLDSPATLRPLLYSLFSWFVGNFPTSEAAFERWRSICFLALFVPAALALVNYASCNRLIRLHPRAARILCSRWLFFASISVCLLLCRFPTLIQDEFNPDEGAFVAAACKLFYRPNYFNSVDCATNGPLNIYPLMLPAIFGFSPDFASSRMLVIVITVLCAFLLYRTVALIAPEYLARLCVLPFAGTMAVLKNTEFRHYSSEYVPLLLLSLALYFSVRAVRHPAAYRVPVFVMGLLCSAAFFSKLQSLPMVVSMAAVALAYLSTTGYAENKLRAFLLFFAGTLPLMLINAAMCVSAGVWKDFWISYVRANVYYADSVSAGFLDSVRLFTDFVIETQEVRLFLFTVLALVAGYLAQRFYTWRVRHQEPYRRGALRLAPVNWFGLLAFSFTASAIYCIYKPHRPFRHYLVFLFLPLSVSIAWMLLHQTSIPIEAAADLQRRQAARRIPRGLPFVALLVVLTLTYQTYIWSLHDNEWFRNAPASIRFTEGDFIRSITDDGPTIFVWGWTSRPFLSSGRVTATRDLQVANCFRSYTVGQSPPRFSPTRQTEEIDHYYQHRVLADLRANPPELIVDAMSIVS